ncbi:hypothetical protein RQM65_06250 [Pricia sp. S334]|uniref:Uncharacterized protein n=1 Tax=Pricia mediterranea TaxID=3076079 RepID=A0ABU3L3V6_9FLAO|nr:hypothetical protein [Pricia sp. S334]MDT7828258.1 hypothetical protein [Pricia sp. S334]
MEVNKLIKEALTTSYLKSPKQNGLFSQYIVTRNFGDIVPSLTASKKHNFLERYIPRNQRKAFRKAIENAFPIVRERLYELEMKKERETLENKFKLIGNILKKRIFDVRTKQGSVRFLFQSLGVKYYDNKLSFTGSNRHTVPVPLGRLPIPNAMEEYVSTGFVRQNHLMLEMLSEQSSENSPKLTATAIFLPMVFPKLYERMNTVHKKQYEIIALASYLQHAERVHAPFEKSPKDYIAFFNAKGFYFAKGEEGFEVKSIYTDNMTSYRLPKRTSIYLNSIPDLNASLQGQQTVINGLVEDGRNDLKNLWAGHLMERRMYDRTAFMVSVEKVYPNLHRDIIQHHMDNGLREILKVASEKLSSIRQNRSLRKGVYAVSSLLGDRGEKQKEVFNGFKDEFTDFTNYKGKGMGLSW